MNLGPPVCRGSQGSGGRGVCVGCRDLECLCEFGERGRVVVGVRGRGQVDPGWRSRSRRPGVGGQTER